MTFGHQPEGTPMSTVFAWVPDPSVGEWLRPLEDEEFGSVLSIVPAGFEAYARVFHPTERERGGDWERITWAEVAAVFGTTMHPGAQFAALTRRPPGPPEEVEGPDEWCYQPPAEGSLDAAALSAVARVAARYTRTPEAGVAAIWDGWGGLVGGSGGIARFGWKQRWGMAFRLGTALGMPARYREAPADQEGSVGDKAYFGWSAVAPRPGLIPFRPKYQPGILPAHIAAGPRLDLHADTGRHYILFTAGAQNFADPAWPTRAPWIDDAEGSGSYLQSPSIWWPEDRAWLVATEIDFDSTLVAGSAAFIAELQGHAALEVLPITPDIDLSWEGDILNRST